MNKNITQLEFDIGNEKQYEVKEIGDNVVYSRESESDLAGLYYLISWNGYLQKQSISKLDSVI